MTKAQFSAAFDIAKSNQDLTQIDDSIVFGCGLSDFKPVYITLEIVAKFIRWQAQFLNGGWDANALNECATIARRKFLIV